MNFSRKSLYGLLFLFFITFSQAQTSLDSLMFAAKKSKTSFSCIGHSHNDYKQDIPLLTAYYAGMQSVEADVFLQNDTLFVAHEHAEIDADKTLLHTYIEPLVRFFNKNQQHVFSDPHRKLQLVIDIKENFEQVIPAVERVIAPYLQVFDTEHYPNGIQIVFSGEMPTPENFKRYPSYFKFDGRPETVYSAEALTHVGMVSQDIQTYTHWNGKGVPTPEDAQKLVGIINKVHAWGKPIRFWATHDSPNTWLVLEKMGVDILNTDHPNDLKSYFDTKANSVFQNEKKSEVYLPKNKLFKNKTPKNIILFIGDGMGLAQIKAAVAANFGNLSIIQMPVIGLARTEASNSDNTDSAAGGTALAAGEKTNNRYIGTNPQGVSLVPLSAMAKKQGKNVAVITTGDVTDATPAVFYAHVLEREAQDSIAMQLSNVYLDVLVGSGRKHFEENKFQGNLLPKFRDQGFHTNFSIADFLKSNQVQQLVLLPDSATRAVKKGRTAWLKQSVQKTMELFAPNKNGFFIMAEGAQVDYGGHANDLKYTVTELLDLDLAVAEALKFADKNGETLVIVTADHETGGLSLLDAAEKQGYVQGHFSTNDHTNIMVPVFAYGPGAEHFSGVYQNTEIQQKIKKLMFSGK